MNIRSTVDATDRSSQSTINSMDINHRIEEKRKYLKEEFLRFRSQREMNHLDFSILR